MSDVDMALFLLENKIRRQILARLVREPHYPLQLAEIINVSQQAIDKHLKELLKGGMVVRTKVPSQKGGPPKTIYSINDAFSLRIDIGPDLFRCEQRKLPTAGPVRLGTLLPDDSRPIAEAIGGRSKISVAEGLSHMRQLSEMLEALDAQRDALIALHQHVRQRVNAGVDSDFEQYEERGIIHSLMEAQGHRIDLHALIQQEMNQFGNATELINNLRTQLERQIARRSGQIIATPLDSEIRWYLGPK